MRSSDDEDVDFKKELFSPEEKCEEETSEERRFVGAPSVVVGGSGRTGSGCHSKIAEEVLHVGV